MRTILLLMLAVCILPGCARMVVKKNPGPHDKGIRYYRPKPYLFIGPAGGGGGQGKEKDEGAGGETQAAPPLKNVSFQPAGEPTLKDITMAVEGLKARVDAVDDNISTLQKKIGDGTTKTTQPITMRIEYLPDYSEEYSIRVTPGFGQATLNVQLENGWNLSSANAVTDQKYAEILASVSQLTTALAGVGGRSSDGVASGEADSNVPMGYYEAVIAVNECGQKQMMGWRYVGFMPCSTCPVRGQVHRDLAICDDEHIYGLVFESGVLQMRRMSVLKQPKKLDCKDCPCMLTEEEPIAPGTIEMTLQAAPDRLQ